jgi:hypothetical protein
VLFPKVSDPELKKLLLWPVQVLRPGIGLIGFEAENKIQLADLLDYSYDVNDTDWSFAYAGYQAKPGLTSILLQPASAAETMAEIKKDLGNKNLQDIPVNENEKRSLPQKIGDGIKLVLFGGILGALKLVDKGASGSGANPGDGKNGMLADLQDWLSKNIEDLQKKRNDEIQRLLNFFDNDAHEALQYAIPLNSPYLHRGNGALPGGFPGTF